MESCRQRSDRLNGAVGVGAFTGSEEDLGGWHVWPCPGGEDFGKEAGALEADGRQIDPAVVEFFCVADEKDGGGRWPCLCDFSGATSDQTDREEKKKSPEETKPDTGGHPARIPG